MSVCALPPSESCANRVSLESRYGTYEAVCDLTLELEGSLRGEMTFPSENEQGRLRESGAYPLRPSKVNEVELGHYRYPIAVALG